MKIILILLYIARKIYGTNYCDPNLCEGDEQHIACNNIGSWSYNCVEPRMMAISEYDKQQILDLHNGFRNKVALGQQQPFPPAAQMQTLQWDQELADLAKLNVKQCTMKHDQCHNTYQYQWAGQNLGVSSATYAMNNMVTVTRLMRKWYNEYQDTSMSIIRRYPEAEPYKMIGHFTAMIQDKASRVGCAVSNFKRGNLYVVLFACNYSYTNVIGAPVYQLGSPASQCRTGRHYKYHGLCHETERVPATPYTNTNYL